MDVSKLVEQLREEHACIDERIKALERVSKQQEKTTSSEVKVPSKGASMKAASKSPSRR